MDVDEQAFRQGHLSAELYGYLLSPYEPHLIQGNKMESPMTESEVENQAAIAIYIIEEMKPRHHLHCRSWNNHPNHQRPLRPEKNASRCRPFPKQKNHFERCQRKTNPASHKRKTRKNSCDTDWGARLHFWQGKPADKRQSHPSSRLGQHCCGRNEEQAG